MVTVEKGEMVTVTTVIVIIFQSRAENRRTFNRGDMSSGDVT